MINLATFPNSMHAVVIAPQIDDRHIKNIYQAALSFNIFNFKTVQIIMPDIANVSGGRSIYDHNENKVSIAYSCNTGNVHDALTVVEQNSTQDDGLLIYVTGHGKITNIGTAYLEDGTAQQVNSGFVQMDDDPLVAHNLAAKVNTTFEKFSRFTFADLCYGFDFMKHFVVGKNTVGISASEEGSSSSSETFPHAFWPNLRSHGSIDSSFGYAFMLDNQRERIEQLPQLAKFDKNTLVVKPTELDGGHYWDPQLNGTSAMDGSYGFDNLSRFKQYKLIEEVLND